MRPTKILALASLLLAVTTVSQSSFAMSETTRITRLCRHLSWNSVHYALKAYHTAKALGYGGTKILTIVDYTKPSTTRRLCMVNMSNHKVIYNTFVAHGANSGDLYAHHFSNVVNSHESSVGLYQTAMPYRGHFGYSMRLNGLDKGFNNHVRERYIVVHGAPYVGASYARRWGDLGRTWGCFALTESLVKPFIHIAEGGSYLFAYYPVKRWLKDSVFLNTKMPNVVGTEVLQDTAVGDNIPTVQQPYALLTESKQKCAICTVEAHALA